MRTHRAAASPCRAARASARSEPFVRRAPCPLAFAFGVRHRLLSPNISQAHLACRARLARQAVSVSRHHVSPTLPSSGLPNGSRSRLTLARTNTVTIPRNLPTPENIAHFRGEMAAWTDERLELEAANDQNAAWAIAAKMMLSERQRSAEARRHSELLAEISLPHWTVVPSFRLLIGTVTISVLALVVAVAALPQVQQALWPSNSTQAVAPSSPPALRVAAPESSNSKLQLLGKPGTSASASSPLKASVR